MEATVGLFTKDKKPMEDLMLHELQDNYSVAVRKGVNKKAATAA
jgi:hypothetical protein